MNKLIVEFIGTFFLVLTIGLAAVAGFAGDMAPLAIGSALMFAIFAGGHVSGGHYNPAVSVGATLRGRHPVSGLAGYIIVQILAAVAAVFTVQFLTGGAGGEPLAIDLPKALMAEFLFTFALVSVVLNVATAKGTEGNSFYGLAIGFTVLTGAYAVGGISGGSFNPAVTVALLLFGKITASQLVAYIVTQLIAGAVAAVVFKIVNPDDK